MNILVLEASTTNAKAMIYNTEAGVVDSKVRKYKEECKDPTLHHAESVFEQLISIGKEISQHHDISLIALSGAWHSVMLCDNEYKPVTPVYTWAYTGASDICYKLREDTGFSESYYKKTGCMVNAIYPFFKLKHLQTEGYNLAQYKILGESTFIYHKLTGAFAVMDSMASGSGLMNTNNRKYDPELLDELNISLSQLPEIISYKDTHPLSSESAEKLGVRAGTPVVAPGPDGALNQIGSDGLDGDVMTFSIGTSGAMRLSSETPNLSEGQSTWCYMTPDGWLSGVATSGACNCVDWVKERLFERDRTYESIEKHFTEISSNGPFFLPFLFGERCPGWDDGRKAQWSNIRAEHTRYDFYHSVLEGVLFNLYQSYLELIKINRKPEVIKLSGGVLHSAYWTQMCADVFNMTIEVDRIKHSSMTGAAVLGENILTGSEHLKRADMDETEKIRPDREKHNFYMKRFEKYLALYHKN